MNASEIPIVKLTVEHMQHSIVTALDQDLLQEQLRKATDNALRSINLEELIRRTVYRLTEEMLQDESRLDPIRERLSKSFDEAVSAMLRDPQATQE